MKSLDKNLLRPNQIDELHGERQQLESNIRTSEDPRADKKMMRRQLAGIDRMMEAQAPEPLQPSEKDEMAKEEKRLRAQITEGMPDDETMRKNPPGAVDWHMSWERKNKRDIMRWKNIRLQLAGDETDNHEIANLERYRPKGGRNSLQTGAQIPGHLSMQGVDPARHDLAFGDQEKKEAALKVLAEEMGMDVDQLRKKVMPKSYKLSEEQREQRRENLKKARAAKAQKQVGE